MTAKNESHLPEEGTMTDDDRESLKESMKEWFLEHYEDPVENTPYCTAEGGYLYQWGGPFDARDVLSDQFSAEADEALIEEAAVELDAISEVWEQIPTLEDLDPLGFSSEFYARYQVSIYSIKVELDKFGASAGDPFMCSLLFAHTITSLEAYLSDAFLTCIKKDKYFKLFVETDPELNKEKLAVSEIYKKLESLPGDVAKRIRSIVFHRLDIVQRMYKETLGIELPKGLKDLFPAIQKRHDIIHRNCKDNEGNEFQVTKPEVEALILIVDEFLGELNGKVDAIIL